MTHKFFNLRSKFSLADSPGCQADTERKKLTDHVKMIQSWDIHKCDYTHPVIVIYWAPNKWIISISTINEITESVKDYLTLYIILMRFSFLVFLLINHWFPAVVTVEHKDCKIRAYARSGMTAVRHLAFHGSQIKKQKTLHKTWDLFLLYILLFFKLPASRSHSLQSSYTLSALSVYYHFISCEE